MTIRRALTVVFAALLALAGTALPASASTPVSLGSSSPAWGTPAQHAGTARPLWAYSVCAGEFISINVAANGFVYGGEQSCTSSQRQTLEFLLLNNKGDVVGAPTIAWTGYQNYIHATNHCSSSAKTLWKEYAYGTASGIQLQPYPAVKALYLNCYTAGISGGCTQNNIRAELIRQGLASIAAAIRVA
ncbi:hypothetical protein SAMN05892883_2418 [Jatrophihabitans sp. GAS493]|uniref:hypothetical protein n=1 Tax=Jatrophihabitans sp. GAS493 TaxID=1907575 RepID=UPI000BC0BFB2|nr:hypothetical protein [Jatrophihabitans sp. GAS493]SOD73127.1 hypothetical protein SAMN05892883_2418 [Jatrophihabitans sp. GAS493]